MKPTIYKTKHFTTADGASTETQLPDSSAF
jgi:hypothetical protein